MDVAIGVDTHRETLAAAAVDGVGRMIDGAEFRNDAKGHQQFLAWVRGQAVERRIGIEGSGSFGAGLARMLLEAGEDVREVPSSLTYRERGRESTHGKSDPIDALAIARVVMRDLTLGSPARVQRLVDLKLLCDYREQLVRTRTRLANRAHSELLVLRPGYQDKVRTFVPRRTSRRPSCSFGETGRFAPISFVAASPAFGGWTARWRTSTSRSPTRSPRAQRSWSRSPASER